jgi:PhzF family phenazine biosynthesis protein
MFISIYQIDAFTDAVFRGNPAAVCLLDDWLDDGTMLAIAAENNLAETAFLTEDEAGGYRLRWFTPTVEVDLCGHATLATAWLIFDRIEPTAETVRFETRSGTLTVSRDGTGADAMLWLDFPSFPGKPVADPPEALVRALGRAPVEAVQGPNWLAVLPSAADVAALEPDLDAVAALAPRCLIVTAPGDGWDRDGKGPCDFVSRFFAPAHGIDEDPVTGSAHCMLTPYWAGKLGRTRMDARQISARGGALVCEDRGARTGIGGRAVLFLEGTIRI